MKLTGCAAIVALIAVLAGCSDRETYLPGARSDLREGSDELSTDQAVNRAVAIRLPGTVNHANWTHRNGSATHRIQHPALSATPSLIWSVDIGESDDRRHRITADPVVADGRIFVMDSRSQVSAVSNSGALQWTYNAVPGHEDRDDASGGGLAVEDGQVYVTTGFGTVTKLNAATGAELWTQRLDAAVTSAPTVRGELVYVMTRDGAAWAIERDNGRIRWSLRGIPSGAVMVGGAGPVATNDIAVFPFATGDLIAAFPRGGVRRWATSIAGERVGRVYAGFMDITGDPVIDRGTLYAGTSAGRLGAIELISGERIWTAQEGAAGPVWPAGGSVFAISDQAVLLRLDASDGSRIWGTELAYQTQTRPRRRQSVHVHHGPVLAGGQLWVASSDGALRAFSPEDGTLLQEIPLPGGATTSMAVAGGTLYVVTENGSLLAFR